MFDEKKYNLPPAIFAALSSGRSELLRAYDVHTLSPLDAKELLVLLGDMIEDRRKEELRAHERERLVLEAVRTLRGQADKLEVTFLPARVVDREEEGAG